MDIDRIAKILSDEEGFVPHAYQDHLGFWTIGHGILIDERKDGGITPDESRYLMANRLREMTKEIDRRLPWWRSQPADCMEALVLMAYQMGVGGLCGFKTMLGHLEAGRRPEAAEAALDSRWARQTPGRARRVAAMIGGE